MSKKRKASEILSEDKIVFVSKWDKILQIWSKLDNQAPLKNAKGAICSRFVIDANTKHESIVTVTNIESTGLHSQIFSIDIDNRLAPVILKKHMSTHDQNVPPEIEAELQKWAHKFKLAPDVKAYNKKAMIIEKCSADLEKEEKERIEKIEEDARNREIAEEELAYRNYQKEVNDL